MKTRRATPIATLLVPLLAACGVPSLMDDGDPNRPDGGSASDGGGGSATGLPCDVSAVLQKSCTSCHGATPSGGAPVSLLTYADLARTSPQGGTMADRSLARMRDANSPMPPKPAAAVSATEIAAFQAWITAGRPAGTCGGMMGADPFAAAPVCTSGSTWTRGNRGSQNMNPGRACIACHKTDNEAPGFFAAGTVYPTGHEPDLCNAPAAAVSGAIVELTGANGVVRQARVNTVGNFSFGANSGLTAPYTARVLLQGRVRAMVAAQTSGDCNTCHTQAGASGAPGRIALP